MASQNGTHVVFAREVRWSIMLASSTRWEWRIDAQMGDPDAVEALFGPGRFEGQAVEAIRGESADDCQCRSKFPQLLEYYFSSDTRQELKLNMCSFTVPSPGFSGLPTARSTTPLPWNDPAGRVSLY